MVRALSGATMVRNKRGVVLQVPKNDDRPIRGNPSWRLRHIHPVTGQIRYVDWGASAKAGRIIG
jgi:hypothetical protein